MANDKETSNKSLFQDPFMDMEAMDESDQRGAVEEVAVKEAVESGAEKRSTPAAKVEATTEGKAAGKAEARPKVMKRTASETTAKRKAGGKKATETKLTTRSGKKASDKATVKSKAEIEVQSKAGPRKRTKTKVATKPGDVKKEVLEAKSGPGARKGGATKAKARPEHEKEPTVEAEIQSEPLKDAAADAQSAPDFEPAEMIAEPEGTTGFLEELIATIDEEVEGAFGPGAMGDLLPAKQVGQAGEEQHVIFALAETEYAAHIDNVIEIGEPPDATLVPNVPNWVLGVANLRGDIISLVDLRAFLGMESIGYGQEKRMVVAQARDEELTTGLIVDRVSGIRHLDVGRISEPMAPIEDQVAPYLRGVYEHEGHLLVVLDLDKLLLSSEMSQFYT